MKSYSQNLQTLHSHTISQSPTMLIRVYWATLQANSHWMGTSFPCLSLVSYPLAPALPSIRGRTQRAAPSFLFLGSTPALPWLTGWEHLPALASPYRNFIVKGREEHTKERKMKEILRSFILIFIIPFAPSKFYTWAIYRSYWELHLPLNFFLFLSLCICQALC